MMKSIVLGAVLALASVGAANAEVIRHTNPNSNFPILRAVEIPPEATLVYLSGAVPRVIDETAEAGTLAAYGDTREQTISVLENIAGTLESLDLTLGDIVKMQVYLVADESGAMDFSGFMDGYVEFFGTEEQPNLPTRSVFEVAGLANAGWLVEIEVVAVRE
ncbi:RidA family protein [Devosia geojensis]|nr:RidA family protein [Devosia geojensis]